MNEAVHSMQELSDDRESPSGPKGNDARELAYRLLLPNQRHPYYIFAPQYTRISAGIKSLHILCNALNRIGERAYLAIHPYSAPDHAVHPQLLTPLLTRGIIEHDYKTGLTPIMVYPEVVSGNPYGAPFVVRYVLNYPGLLGGDETYPENEFCITYSHELASVVPNTKLTLFVPASDPNIFTPEPREERKGSCFYAGKYREIHGGELFDVTHDSVEIHRLPPRAQTPEQIAELFRRSEVFYTYENTALVIEALMCECPVVFLPNEHLTGSIGARELGWDGIAWGTDEAEIARAKATVNQGRENYLRLFDEFARVLPEFIKQTQKEAAVKRYETPVDIRYPRISSLFQLLTEKAELFQHIRVEKGLSVAIKRTVLKFLKVFVR